MKSLTRRDAAGGLFSFLASAAPAASLFAKPEAGQEPLWFVNPELRPIAREMQRTPFPPLTAEKLPQARRTMSAMMAQPPLTSVPFAKRVIDGPKNAPAVTIYIVNAKPGAKRAGILHTHGGGYILGSAENDIQNLQTIASALDCGIVTVDYRLAPETPFAGSIEDNYTGLHWLHDHADEVGVDRRRIAVMGESAGGGHAALLAIAARDRGEIPVAFQCLVYPMLDDHTGSTRAVPAPLGSISWSASANRLGWRSFLGQEPGTPQVPAAGVPARVASTSGLPPAWIGVGSIDLFVDEDLDYARRLIDAGVMTQVYVAPGAFHGFDAIARHTEVAENFTASKIAALRTALT
jgi:acetyl esterase/lipase